TLGLGCCFDLGFFFVRRTLVTQFFKALRNLSRHGLLERMAMFFPGVRPLGCLAFGKLAEEVVGVFAMKVVGKKFRRAVVGDDASEEYQHRVVESQMGRTGGHRKRW